MLIVGKYSFAALTDGLDRAETDGFVKIVADAATSKCSVCNIVGPAATDLISEGVWRWKWAHFFARPGADDSASTRRLGKPSWKRQAALGESPHVVGGGQRGAIVTDGSKEGWSTMVLSTGTRADARARLSACGERLQNACDKLSSSCRLKSSFSCDATCVSPEDTCAVCLNATACSDIASGQVRCGLPQSLVHQQVALSAGPGRLPPSCRPDRPGANL